MTRRHPRFHPDQLPRLWLMTDERMGHALLPAIDALPCGAGIVFRHYALSLRERRTLFAKVRRIARRRGLMLVLAGPSTLARQWGAQGFHGSRGSNARDRLIHTAPAHDVAELRAATARGADLIFVSPVYSTRSHPGQKPLGRIRFALLARQSRRPVIALGGMTARRARALDAFGIHGWAGIDGLTPGKVRT